MIIEVDFYFDFISFNLKFNPKPKNKIEAKTICFKNKTPVKEN